MALQSVLVTGGAGFVGSHVAEFFARRGIRVRVFDNLSRMRLLGKSDAGSGFSNYNWNYLKRFENVELVRGDVRDKVGVEEAMRDIDVVVHAAAQTAVTASLDNPVEDFEVNAFGTFNVLEAARRADVQGLVFCSTNKVYGGNVNSVGVRELGKRYEFEGCFSKGIPEGFSIDLCEHTPYGCSKLAADVYVQDFAHVYGLRAGVFRMSCIYGTRQFGVEDQGWVAWFTIATLLGRPITIYGDGKQVRDVLYVSDLVNAFDAFFDGGKSSVYNIGGGPENTVSLLELLTLLEGKTGKRPSVSFAGWRPSDQKVFVSDISKVERELGWKPSVSIERGLEMLVEWVKANAALF